MHCSCGADKVLALGLRATCYTLRRQDAEYFGGYRETVLARNGYRCRVPECKTLKRGKRSGAVHHRVPGNSDQSSCVPSTLPAMPKSPGKLFVEDDWPPFLRELWREQHPEGHEQTRLDFKKKGGSASEPVPPFADLTLSGKHIER